MITDLRQAAKDYQVERDNALQHLKECETQKDSAIKHQSTLAKEKNEAEHKLAKVEKALEQAQQEKRLFEQRARVAPVGSGLCSKPAQVPALYDRKRRHV
jgi:chromosome segregation ATPase